jgi:hypothetical protein
MTGPTRCQAPTTLKHAPRLTHLPAGTFSDGYCTGIFCTFSLFRLGPFLPVVFWRQASPFRCGRRGPSSRLLQVLAATRMRTRTADGSSLDSFWLYINVRVAAGKSLRSVYSIDAKWTFARV